MGRSVNRWTAGGPGSRNPLVSTALSTAALIAGAVMTASPAAAATWNVTGAPGVYNDPANWGGNIPDGAGETADFTGNDTGTVTLGGTTVSPDAWNFSTGNYTLVNGTASLATLSIVGGGSQTFGSAGNGLAVTTTGLVTLSGGSLSFGAGSGSSLSAGSISQTGSFVFNLDNSASVSTGAYTMNAGGGNVGNGTMTTTGLVSLLDGDVLSMTITGDGTNNALINGIDNINNLSSLSGFATITITSGTNLNGTMSAATLFDVNNPAAMTIGGALNGAAALTKTGAGTATLSATNGYTGTTTVSAGVLDVTGSVASTSIVVNGTGQFIANGSSISDAANVDISGTGDLNLAASETIGSLSGTAGTVTLGANTLTIAAGAGGDYAGVIGGVGGSVTLSGGTQTLSGANTYTGTTTVSGGTLTLGAGNVLANGSSVVVSGGTLAIGANSDTVAGVSLQSGSITGAGGTLTSTTAFDAQSGSASANLGGTVGLNKTTAGTVTLTGTNSYSGLNTLTGGILSVSASANLGDGSATNDITFNGGTLQVTGTFSTNRDILASAGGGTFDVTGANNLTLTGVITGSGPLAKTNVAGSTVTLNGDGSA